MLQVQQGFAQQAIIDGVKMDISTTSGQIQFEPQARTEEEQAEDAEEGGE